MTAHQHLGARRRRPSRIMPLGTVRYGILLTGILLLLGCRAPARPPADAAGPTTPAAAADSLLAADRALSRAAAGRPFPEALAQRLERDVRMPAARGEILLGREAIRAALAATPDSTARASWTPVRAGVSADGLHGFAAGFLVTRRDDGSRAQFRYLGYWVRRHVREGSGVWQLAAWRRRPMELVAIDSTPLPPLLPRRLLARTDDPAVIAAHVASLRAAEAEFSALANRIGVGAAFAQRGTRESLNIGPPTDGRFTRGADAIARVVAGGQPLDAPSTIEWGADTALVASSGDLGITFGVIRRKGDPRTAPGAAFFTIWRREREGWRYVAE